MPARLDRRNLVLIYVRFPRGRCGTRIAEYLGERAGSPSAPDRVRLRIWDGRAQRFTTVGESSRRKDRLIILGRPAKDDVRLADLKRLRRIVPDPTATVPALEAR